MGEINPLQFIPVLDRRANLLFFPVKPSVELYSDRKPRACQKLGNGPGVVYAQPPGSAKFANAPPPRLTRQVNAPQ